MRSTNETRDSDEIVLIDRETHLHLTLNRLKLNLLNRSMYLAISSAFHSLSADTRPILISGHDGNFSAGFDTRQLNVGEPAAITADARECFRSIEAHPALVVAAVEGVAVGAGLLIAACADLLIVAENARLGMPEARTGVVPDTGPLHRWFPASVVRQLCLVGEIRYARDMHLEPHGVRVTLPGHAELEAHALLQEMAADESGNVATAVKASVARG